MVRQHRSKMRLMSNLIYPGGNLWIKRLKHLCILCSVTIQIWVDNIQNEIVLEGERLTALAQSMNEPAIEIYDGLTSAIADVVSKGEKYDTQGWLGRLSIPKSEQIRNSKSGLHVLQENLRRMSYLLHSCGAILLILDILWLGAVAFSFLWIVLDIIKSKVKGPAITIVLLSLLINYILYTLLHQFFNV